MFVNRTEAVKFAMFENGNRPQAVIMVPGILELDMSGKPGARAQATADAQPALAQRIIVAGSKSPELMFELHRRGYVRELTGNNGLLPHLRTSLAEACRVGTEGGWRPGPRQ
jgi:hypothetical protein